MLALNRTFFLGSLASLGIKFGGGGSDVAVMSGLHKLAVWAVTGGKADLSSPVIRPFPRQL